MGLKIDPKTASHGELAFRFNQEMVPQKSPFPDKSRGLVGRCLRGMRQAGNLGLAHHFKGRPASLMVTSQSNSGSPWFQASNMGRARLSLGSEAAADSATRPSPTETSFAQGSCKPYNSGVFLSSHKVHASLTIRKTAVGEEFHIRRTKIPINRKWNHIHGTGISHSRATK